MRAKPPVIASKHMLCVRAKMVQAHNTAKASNHVAKNKQPKSNLLLALTYGICNDRKLVLQCALCPNQSPFSVHIERKTPFHHETRKKKKKKKNIMLKLLMMKQVKRKVSNYRQRWRKMLLILRQRQRSVHTPHCRQSDTK